MYAGVDAITCPKSAGAPPAAGGAVMRGAKVSGDGSGSPQFGQAAT
jgi:hypothetical protein